jgi:RNA polymerase II subunit A small phosphatase-like protein
MSGESTGRDLAPESTDKAMSTSGLPGSTSKSLCLTPYIPSWVNEVADVVSFIDESPEQGRGTDATEIQDASAVAPSDPVPSSAEPAKTAPDAAEAAQAPKKRGLLKSIRSRRSLNNNKQSASEANEAQDRRGSNVSSVLRKRGHSRASSGRSRQTQNGANAESKETESTPESSPSKPQKTGPSKLLAFLSCCSSSDIDNDDAALPAKKTTVRPDASNRLPTPDKAEAHTGESSTAESREPYLDEKANSTVSADQAGEEHRDVQAIAGGTHEGPSTGVVQPEASGQKDQKEEISAPSEAEKANGSVHDLKANEPIHDGHVQPDTANEVAAPTSTEPTSTAPTKSFNTDGNEDVANHQEEASPPPQSVALPPPPPPTAPIVPSVRGYPENIPNPLLPAVPAHLSGRKCLVLDLDETLVHSSFKVCKSKSQRTRQWRVIVTLCSPYCIGFGTCRLYHSGRDRRTVSQYLCDQASWCGRFHETCR